MELSKGRIFVFAVVTSFFSCNEPRLDGHYHLVWDKDNEQFQTWNIRNNRMRINDDVCIHPDSCFASVISFKGDTITIDPWVDNTYRTYYEMDKSGVVTMRTSYDTLWLVPQNNCVQASEYFSIKTKHLADSFNLISETMSGFAAFPKNYKNELIIGGLVDSPFFLFNGKVLTNIEAELKVNKLSDEDVWIHVDYRISLQAVLPAIKRLHESGYHIFYSAIQTGENSEQISLMGRTIKSINESPQKFQIDYCENCSKYPKLRIDSIIKIKMLDVDSYSTNGLPDNLFHIRNNLVRHIVNNRVARLNTQIQIEIDGSIEFWKYLRLVDNLRWIQVELQMTTYQGLDDPDAEEINQKQDTWEEFPIRIKEIITTMVKNHYSN